MPRPKKEAIKGYASKRKGAYNKPKQLAFYTTIPELVHTPLLDFEREHFYTRDEISTLSRKGVLSLVKWSGIYFVAVCPDYENHDPKKLKELI